MEPESNVLLASIENMQYAVTLDVLHTVTIFKHSNLVYMSVWAHFFVITVTMFSIQVFSAFGQVLKIAMFDKNGGLQALIQYPGKMELFTSVNTSSLTCIISCWLFLFNMQEKEWNISLERQSIMTIIKDLKYLNM